MSKLWEELRKSHAVQITTGVFYATKQGCLRVQVEEESDDGLYIRIGTRDAPTFTCCSESAETLAEFFAEVATYLKSVEK